MLSLQNSGPRRNDFKKDQDCGLITVNIRSTFCDILGPGMVISLPKA
jgi:hypothetical protein